MQYPDPVQLRNVLSEYYSVNDLGNMCYDMGIDYEGDLGGGTKSAKIRSLITYMKNRGRLGELVAYVQETRPFIQLKMSDAPATTPTAQSQTPAQPTSVTHNYYGSVSQHQGDTINMSGDFRGSNVNVKSTLKKVNQTIGTLPQADDAAKAELRRQIAQLNDALQQVPPEKAEEADAVTQMTEALVETANSDKPNKMMMQITGEGLKKAAANLAEIVPDVVKIAGAIVTGIFALA